ncbi:MAG: tripartite tricarboxylate transporter substrate-binding protein [Rhodovarius sp.]|nr:tripartite tricarboxylate transporter substrate-binding protein [Rhodovarius sp.]
MTLPRRRLPALLAAPALAAAVPGLPRPAAAQGDWPREPIRWIMPYAAGGPTDLIARMLADRLSQMLPQRVVVENRTGAGGNIGAAAAARATPDGHTWLFHNTGLAVARALYARLDYDPERDLVPVTIVAESPMVMLVPATSPDRSVADLVARARAHPGRLTYATSGSGGALQLVTLLFLQAAGIRMEEVAYRGSAPAYQDLIAGRLDLLYDAALTALQQAQGGQVRALAVSSAQRSRAAPHLPTIAEVGYPQATFVVWQALLAPRGTPEPILQRMQQAVAAALAEPALANRLAELGAERLVGNSVEEAGRYVRAEIERWSRVLREAGIEPQ